MMTLSLLVAHSVRVLFHATSAVPVIHAHAMHVTIEG